jgi:simple sugar transport system permease protein
MINKFFKNMLTFIKDHWLKFWKNPNSFKTSLIAILAGFLFGFIILFIVHPLYAFPALFSIILDPFTSGLRGIGDVLYKAAPIILTGLSVGFAFKTGLFNIGAAGQFLISAAVTVLVGQIKGIDPSIHWVIALMAGTMAGAIWGFVPGLIKALANVNEVVSTIMMNYIALHMSSLLITKLATTNDGGYAVIRNSAYLPKWGLDKLFNYPVMIDISVLIAIAVAIIVWFIIEKTTLGYQLKAVGYNFNASRYAGINEKRNVIISMVIAGALSGIAGSVFYLGGTQLGTAPGLPGEGFVGITVSLLANSNPLGIILAGYFTAHLAIGGTSITVYDYLGEVTSIVTAAIVYFCGIAVVLQMVIARLKKHKKKLSGIVKEGDK